MGISIEAMDPAGPVPRKTTVTLSCDKPSSLICRRFVVLCSGDYVADRAAATAQGWLERFDMNGRSFICPECK